MDNSSKPTTQALNFSPTSTHCPNRILVNGIEIAWNPQLGQCLLKGSPVALMRVGTTLAGLMANMQAMVGTERFMLALQSEGRSSIESDWLLISKFADFQSGFAALNNMATVAGWGVWQLIKYDIVNQECVFRVYGNWEGLYQKNLQVCWGSGILAGKLAGICSKLFNTNCWAYQTAFVANGDAFDEFVVAPSERSIDDEIGQMTGCVNPPRPNIAQPYDAKPMFPVELSLPGTLSTELLETKTNLARLVEVRTQEMHQATMQLQAILDSSPVGICRADQEGNIDYVNHEFTRLFGFTSQDMPPINRWSELACTDRNSLAQTMSDWLTDIERCRTNFATIAPIEIEMACKTGGSRRVIISTAWINGRLLVNFSDISERWRIQQRELSRHRILEMIAKALPLPNILNAIVLEIENEDPSILCSILLLDQDAKHLRTGAAPSLPDFFNKQVNGLAIGAGVGSCGTAAYRGERVIVENLQDHPYWESYKGLAKSAGLHACWSEPIMSSKNKVLGTFAIYHRKPAVPNLADIERINYAANIAGIAIEHHQTTAELERQANIDYLTGLANRRKWFEQAKLELQRTLRYGKTLSMLMLDIDHFKAVNDGYGHITGDKVLKKLSETCKEVLREIDVVGRFGGEEFVVLLPETDCAHAMDAAERLRSAVENSKLCLENNLTLQFTVSIGVASLRTDQDSIDMILSQADKALYEAKRKGRNRVALAI